MASFKLPLAPFWASPFRPFCALGMAYGIVLMALWVAAQSGYARSAARRAVRRSCGTATR